MLKHIYLCVVAVCMAVGLLSYLRLGQGSPAEKAAGGIAAGEGILLKTDSLKADGPRIAITFDDGPHGKVTERLLDGLKERNVRAAFFLIGNEIEGNEKLVKRMKKEGHLIGNHTWTHVQLTTLSDKAAAQELFSTNRKIAELTGKEPEFMRPPFGTISKKVEKKTKLIPILWSVDSKDWMTANADEIVNRVVTQTEDGDIILLHDCYESSVDAALRIIDLLQAQGYEFVTADEMVTD